MQKRPDRIVVDTNIWISFLISKNYSTLDKILIQKKAVLLFSEELLDEFLEVIKRPKLKNYFSSRDIDNILRSINNYSEIIDVNSQVKVCRDSKDDFLLALSVDGNADYLLTGDKDLLELEEHRGIKIITITEYFKFFS